MFRSYWLTRVVKAAALPARASATSVVSFSRWIGILVLGAGKRPGAPPGGLPPLPPPRRPGPVNRPAGGPSTALRASKPAVAGKLGHILACAARVFCEKGYEGASIRDIARRSRVSLAGLYYYVASKEELLYLIQKHSFTTLRARAEEQLVSAPGNPEARLRLFIGNHLSFFLQRPEAMKVLSHESESLTAPYAQEVTELKRSYYRLCRNLLEELKREKGLK